MAFDIKLNNPISGFNIHLGLDTVNHYEETLETITLCSVQSSDILTYSESARIQTILSVINKSDIAQIIESANQAILINISKLDNMSYSEISNQTILLTFSKFDIAILIDYIVQNILVTSEALTTVVSNEVIQELEKEVTINCIVDIICGLLIEDIGIQQNILSIIETDSRLLSINYPKYNRHKYNTIKYNQFIQAISITEILSIVKSRISANNNSIITNTIQFNGLYEKIRVNNTISQNVIIPNLYNKVRIKTNEGTYVYGETRPIKTVV